MESFERQEVKPLRILHIEDSPTDAELIYECLSDSGFHPQIDLVSTEQDFNSSLKRGEYDVILADYVVPGFDAPAALRLAKSLTSGIPFICVSGAIGGEQAVELLKLGATDYVLKDRLDKLPLALKRALDEVSERKAHQLAEEVRHELSQAIEQSPVSVMITDTMGVIQYVNTRFVEVTGYNPEEVIGTNPRFLKSGYTALNEYEELWNTITTGGEWHGEFHNKKKNGELFWENAKISPIVNAFGETTHYLAIKEDITDRKLAEEKLLQSLLEKETLIRELYHRTRNTLQVIRSMLVLQAADYSPNTDIQKLVKNTEDRIQTISLVHQMLYASKDLSQISVKEYVGELSGIIMQGFKIPKDQITLRIYVEGQYFLLDTAIPFGLVLSELMTNSLKYAFPDNRKGIISIELRRKDSDKYALHYSDNGVGVEAGFDFRKQNTLGLKLIFSIGEQQMLGKVNMQSNNGISCDFEFPDNLYKARV